MLGRPTAEESENVAKKTAILVNLFAALCLCLGVAGGLQAQPTLNVSVTGTLGSVIGGSGFITTGGKYESGITATGTKGQYCLITYNGGTNGTAKVILNATYTTPTAVPGPITIALPDLVTYGTGYSDTNPPTTATASNGTATCSGTATLTGVLVDDPLGLHGNSFGTTSPINPVGIGYSPSSIEYPGLTLTLTDFSQAGLTLSCTNAEATVTASSGGDSLSFGSCTFTPKIGTATFVSTLTFPGGSLPAPIPMAFSAAIAPGSNGTYTLESGSVFNGDASEIGIGGTITATCSGCPTESLTPTGPLSFTAAAGGSAPAAQPVTVNTGGTVEAYAVTTSVPWITVGNGSTTGGSTGGSFNVDVNPSGLPPGNYTGTVCVYTAASNSSYAPCAATGNPTPTVTVNLTVTSSLVGTPSTMTFNSVNAAVPPTQPLAVTTSPSSSVPYTATASSTGNWLTVNGAGSATGTTGGAAITVAVNPSLAPAGVNTGTITLSSTANGVNPTTVTVTFNVTTGFTSPSPVTFSTVAGVNPPSQTLSVTASAGPAVTYSAAVTSGNAWLSVTPGTFNTSGGGPTVSVNVGALTANTSGTISVTPTAPNSTPISVTVNLTFLPVMVSGSPSLTFTSSAGAVPASQPLAITSSNGTAISYSAVASSTPAGWLLVSPPSGSTPGSETVSINLAGLATGTYTGAVLFTCTPTASCGNASGQLSVPVTLKVTAALTAPSAITFNYTIGSAGVPAAQPIAVTSNGAAITYTATAASSISWLLVSPASATTPTGVTASVNQSALTNLAPGQYSGTITLASTGASNSPVTINATLVVSAALVSSSNSFAFTSVFAGSAPPIQTLTISSNSATQLSFTAVANGVSGATTWLSVSAPSGPTPQTLNISVSPGSLPASTTPYSGSITITSAQAGNSPLVIPVTLTVTSTPGLTTSPSSLSASYTLGGSVPTLPTVTIGTDGSTPLTGVSVSTVTPWLKASVNQSTTPAIMTVSLVQASIPTTPGSYSGSITISSTSAGVTSVNYPVTLTVLAQPVIAVSPMMLTFTGQVSGANPAAQPLSVTSINGSVTFTAAAASTGGWLSVSAPTGPTNTTVQVSVNTKGLAVGPYTGSVTITSPQASGSPQVVTVSLNVTALPVLITTPTALSFNYTTGSAAPAGQSVAVSTSNGASAAFTVSASTTSNGSWLQVSPSAGNSPASFVASFVPGSLTAGTYTGTITVSATGFTSTSVPVTVVVTQPKAVIQVTGSAVFTLANSAAPVTNTLAISSSDGSAQAFTITEGSSPNSAWLTLSATSGTTPANIRLTATPTGLAPGIYVIPLTVTMPALPVPTKTIMAQLTVTGSNLEASPSMLTFAYQLGLPLPATQTVSLTAASGTGSVSLTSITANVGWLRVSPASSVPAVLQVSINPAALTVGTLTGDILVTTVGSPFVSLQIPVTITVTAAPQFTATPASLAFTYQPGGALPVAQSVAFASGSVPLNFTATSPGNWLQVSPLRGTTPASVTVTANPAGLAAGTYGGTINVNTFGVSNSLAIPVTLTIAGAPQLSIAPSQLFFAAPIGGSTPAPQTLAVTGYTAASSSAWLAVTPTSGTASSTAAASLSVSVKLTGLAVGTYIGAIDITPAGSAQTLTVVVTLQVGSGGPTPTITAAINAASGITGTVVPGMAVSIFGANLGPQTGVGFAAPPEGGTVAITLAGTEVLFDGAPAPVLFTMAGQVNALAPFELVGKTSTVVEVVYNGVTSAGTTLAVEPAEPGLFTANASGKGQGAILNQDGTVNSASNPAAAGSTIQLFGTGGGVTIPPSTDGALNPLTSTGALALGTTATVGGLPATVYYSGPAPNLVSGIFQIDVTLPSGTPSGNVPVVVTVVCPAAPLPVPAACAGFPSGYGASSQTITVAVQ